VRGSSAAFVLGTFLVWLAEHVFPFSPSSSNSMSLYSNAMFCVLPSVTFQTSGVLSSCLQLVGVTAVYIASKVEVRLGCECRWCHPAHPLFTECLTLRPAGAVSPVDH
jgi:hypothetical protein